jgi:hypothetical protein
MIRKNLFDLIDDLENNDDAQDVWANVDYINSKIY